ncbi:hypothetical protein IV203_025103 [Nitzschia inconspicua]|uniref:Phytase-like domain-containing protein n=1 Tax=Nitzschia inconspicua TaxID=303405 RepID=A0A9K3K9M1_9STRA|nr:hypothetical protein IV203_025153 [Nitzschia inconspicua]KAG7365662.1 hypothetical protein IV203_025103 [Nitzschia inconspicua]
MMKISSLLPCTTVLTCLVSMTTALSFRRSDVGNDSLAGDILTLKDRIYVPYGPDLTSTPVQSSDDQPWNGYGYGTGATEHWAYDTKEKYVYSQSEIGGYITVLDYATLPASVTEFSIDFGGQAVDVRDVVVCSEQGLLFLTVTDRSTVLMYDVVKRSDPKKPTLINTIQAGNSPDALKLSNDCSILAVANQNEGTSMINEGSLTLVRYFRSPAGPQTTKVDLSGFTDEYLLGRNVHMPLTKNAMEYWNNELDLGWDAAGGLLEQYNPALIMDPEFMAFNEDGSELYLNLQVNSALVRIDTATGQALSVDGYGLKPATLGTNGFDIVNDGECKLVTNPCLFLGKTPDGIFSLQYEGVNYVLTADEGSDFDLDDYEEKFDSQDLFLKNGTFAFNNWTFAEDFLVPGDASKGCTANFNEDCEALGLEWCSNFEITVGSSAVDYSDPTSPKFERIVGFGGRGISVFRVPESTSEKISLVWDSASQFEQEICSKFPWANNAVQNEDFAPVEGARWILGDESDREDIHARSDPLEDGCTLSNGSNGACPMSKTVDELAEEDGLAVESVVAGVACDRLVMIGCGENNGICLLYDITDGPERPVLLKTFSTSPASRDMNPQQAYDAGELGDLDTETMMMVTDTESPTGKAGIIMGGAISGTISFYEFVCQSHSGGGSGSSSSGVVQATSSGNESGGVDDGSGLSGGAIAGIVIVSIAIVALIVYSVIKSSRTSQKEMDTGVEQQERAVEGVA